MLKRYTPDLKSLWDSFVVASRNGTFLLRRDYMDYHADRFADCSWIALKKDRPIALLPANITPDGTLHSHGGLTYGGWILPSAHLDGSDLLDIFSEACDIWRNEGIAALDYKTIPHIYARQPSADDEYALFRLGARLSECNLSAAIDLRHPGGFNKLQKRHLAKTSASISTSAKPEMSLRSWRCLRSASTNATESAPCILRLRCAC